MARVIVVGGGAAGFFASIVCAERHPEAEVILLEAGRDPLAKVRISGGGRCNVTHACFEPAQLVQHYPRGGKALRGAFSRFQPQDTIAWFAQRGVPLKTEADGRMFPVTDSSETIIDCLQGAAIAAGVKLWTQAPVTGVSLNPRFAVQLKSGQILESDRLLLATGSSPQGYRLAQSLGHSLVEPVPSLFTFNLKEPALRELAGVAVPVALQLHVGPDRYQQTGPLLVTHWGLSGPAVLKLSAWAARSLHTSRYHAELSIDWTPGQAPETLRQQLLSARQDTPRKQLANYRPVDLPQRLWLYLLQRFGLDPGQRWTELSKRGLQQLLDGLKGDRYSITGKGVFKDEFVTCGGIPLGEVNFKTLESKRCPGLYFAGEILDVDGVTGGFNFQNAWTTGWIAGEAILWSLVQPIAQELPQTLP